MWFYRDLTVEELGDRPNSLYQLRGLGAKTGNKKSDPWNIAFGKYRIGIFDNIFTDNETSKKGNANEN